MKKEKIFNYCSKDMENQYGTTYGTVYFFFLPATKQEIKEAVEKAVEKGICSKYWNIYKCVQKDDDFYKFGFMEEYEKSDLHDDGDVWNQVSIKECSSVEEAIERYCQY